MRERLLIIDNDSVFCNLLKRHFESEYEVAAFTDPGEAIGHVRGHPADVILTDLTMPKMDGLEVLREVKSGSLDTDVIIMTAFAKVDSAVEAMKKGAYDYIIKPFSIDELAIQLNNLFEKRRLAEENAGLRKFIDIGYSAGNLIGRSEAAREIRRFVERVSQSDYAVLITGESGAGKELAAKAIHFTGKRKDRKFLQVHCAAMKEDQLEIALFGCERETSPGAKDEKRGVFEEAEGGTVVLDEIAAVAPSLQIKLLMALEEGAVRRVGGEREIPFDAMVIATASDDLKRLSDEGRFRQDLYYRLDMVSLRVPPLRERKKDIPLLAEHFFGRYKAEFGREGMTLTGEALELLKKYHWPGNVRELKGLFAKLCFLEGSDVITPEIIAARLEFANPLDNVASFFDTDASLDDFEKNLITESLKKAGGNITKASKLLNVSYDTLRYRMKKYGIK